MSPQAALQLDPSTIVSTNPGRNYEVVGEVRVSSAGDIAVAVRQARAAQPAWQELGVAGRVKALGPVASLFEQHRQEIAELRQEEVFGPVLPVISYKTEDEAITLANDTIYGLSGYIYTASRARAEKLASLMQTGSISHNGTDYSGPHNPFGGYKMSGFRKSGGKHGFRDACRIKAVCLHK
jgi:acyl-CoA reductase-like NAD-dependent aldehyde dehydrogenase